MRSKIYVLTFLIAIFQILLALPSNSEVSKRWCLGLEVGAGTLIGISGYYWVNNKLGAGITTGFDVGDITVLNKEYISYLMNLDAAGIYRILKSNSFTIDLRLKIGYNWVWLETYSAKAFEIAPEFLLGYTEIYGIISMPYITGKDQENVGWSEIIPQIGLGYRISF